jgi:hypothetical protein
MSGSRPEQVLDPVCGMTVNVAAAEAAERAAQARPAVDPGICEVAEAQEAGTGVG